MNRGGQLAERLFAQIEGGVLDRQSVSAFAAAMGLSARHVHRLLQTAYGVGPLEIALTRRLLNAKQLLSDTSLSIKDVAFAAGFASIRSMNALFRDRYGFPPSALQLHRGAQTQIVCRLSVRPPYAWRELLAFFQTRAIPGIEHVDEAAYTRMVRIRECVGSLRVTFSERQQQLQVAVSASLAPALVSILRRVRDMFDVDADPLSVAEQLGSLAETCPGLRVPGAFDPFELAVRAVLGQQVSVKIAVKMLARFAAAFGEPVEHEAALTHTFPDARHIAALDVASIASLGIIKSRAAAIIDTAKLFSTQALNFSPGSDWSVLRSALLDVKGIGPWTADYLMMRGARDPDIFLAGDVAVQNALGGLSEREAQLTAEAWRPFRSYAVMHLWRRGAVEK